MPASIAGGKLKSAMPDDDHHKKSIDDLNRSFENIERARNAPPSGLYADFAEMIDGQARIAAERAAGKAPTKPKLTVIKEEPPLAE